jgi:hypothetical protein
MLAAGFGDPVPMVRRHSARPPDRSVRTVGKRRPTLGHPLACTVNQAQARAFAGESASIHCRTLLGGAQSNSRSTAHGATLSFRAVVSPSGHGRIEDSVPSGESATSSAFRADGCCPLSSRLVVTSTHLHVMREPCTGDGRINCRCRFPRPQIVSGVRCLALLWG